jgi:hypothetical protein
MITDQEENLNQLANYMQNLEMAVPTIVLIPRAFSRSHCRTKIQYNIEQDNLTFPSSGYVTDALLLIHSYSL